MRDDVHHCGTTTGARAAWTPLRLRDVTLPNRVWMSPMCQYSAEGDGTPTDWHLAHYGARAAGGLGLVTVECTAVAPDMRTTVRDLGLWNDQQIAGHRRLTEMITTIGSVPAVQLGVAGRKSSHGVPWDNAGTRSAIPPDEGGWQPLAPSPVPFAGLAVPAEMSSADGERLLDDLERAARAAHRAGYQLLELHGANGYLFHEFLSPLANHRTDEWGGDLRARMRFPLAMVRALRAGWPEEKPLAVRIPAEDLLDGGLTVEDMTVVAAGLSACGVDLIDLSSGALVPEARRLSEPLHNAQYGPLFRASGAAIAASGEISSAAHLDEAVPALVDAVFVGRALLRDPYWALRAKDSSPAESWPRQYRRAF
ncbi:oxidoreductase [Amycolatopsis silviterrae]|uniref:NADH:flavin oxidoreductase/NADH oxidase n=1 Tax=Amycolatopsis silviterrae TaxID=1656914 RepID=A0ABW5H4I4_9PSEU